MKVMKILISLAITMAFAITIITITTTIDYTGTKKHQFPHCPQKPKNPRAADHCHKDNEICTTLEIGGTNTTCCNNKCIDLLYNDHNCGACKKKCPFTETCCRGECVNLSFDKRHCGYCNNRCMTGGYCFYGMCDYA
ncbi:hypothetical protein H5410_028630 [Solanum commersonii]|uniref:Stigma-specific Stig1 family protein n=1 Tax=Solanum commersonii TaxID=4109 RepID=A0A9J5Z380_SOLCO|nr:hypothetical protein H5410_028630 [Solanum commersonii]